MFLTADSNEMRVSSMISGPGVRCWTVVQLELMAPLFFPTWVVDDGGIPVAERALIVNEGL